MRLARSLFSSGTIAITAVAWNFICLSFTVTNGDRHLAITFSFPHTRYTRCATEWRQVRNSREFQRCFGVESEQSNTFSLLGPVVMGHQSVTVASECVYRFTCDPLILSIWLNSWWDSTMPESGWEKSACLLKCFDSCAMCVVCVPVSAERPDTQWVSWTTAVWPDCKKKAGLCVLLDCWWPNLLLPAHKKTAARHN